MSYFPVFDWLFDILYTPIYWLNFTDYTIILILKFIKRGGDQVPI